MDKGSNKGNSAGLMAILGAALLAGLVFFFLKFFKTKKVEEQKESLKETVATNVPKMDVNYVNKLSPQAKTNAGVFIDEMKKEGITNPYTQTGILSVVSKESGFIPKSENLDYSIDRLIQVFAMKDPHLVAQIAHRPEQIANIVYMPPHNTKLGNVKPGDGWLFRGRGYNQITGRANYDKIGKQIGVDLVSKPDLLNDPRVAAKAAIQFFKNGIEGLKKNGRLSSMYNSTGLNDFKNEIDAVGAFYNINAGVNASIDHINKDVTGGRALAYARSGALLELAKTA